MRKMTESEIVELIDISNWATICTVGADQRPYAIEATPFDLDGAIGFMINPRGATQKNLLENKNVLLKYTYAKADLSVWAGVTCYGHGEFVTDPALMRRGWEALGEVMRSDMSQLADRFCSKPERSPMLLVRVTEMTGRCNAKPGQPLSLPDRVPVAEEE